MGVPKTYDWEKEEVIAVSFYPRRDGTGGAMREQLIYVCKKGDHINGRYLNMARRKAQRIGAKSFRLFKGIPRVFAIPKEECDCESCL